LAATSLSRQPNVLTDWIVAPDCANLCLCAVGRFLCAHEGSPAVLKWIAVAMFAFLASPVAQAQVPKAKTKLAVLPAQLDESAKGKVPKLFDDYLLTAVQNAGDFEVVGQEDINSMLGFEKQKEVMGCDDNSCLAQIGGALGVDRIVAVKIAIVQGEWVSTAKIINIREARVEARSSDFVTGDVKELLRAVPAIVAKLFAGGGAGKPSAAAPTPRDTVAPTDRPGAVGPIIQPTRGPNESIGRGTRIAGVVLYLIGLASSATGIGYALAYGGVGSTSPLTGSLYTTDDGGASAVGGSLFWDLGLILSGVGSGMYINGRARGSTGDEGASGHSGWSWLGWTTFSVAAAGPIVGLAVQSRGLALATGVGGALVSSAVFGLRMITSGTVEMSDGTKAPLAQFMLIPTANGHSAPGMGLSYNF